MNNNAKILERFKFYHNTKDGEIITVKDKTGKETNYVWDKGDYHQIRTDGDGLRYAGCIEYDSMPTELIEGTIFFYNNEQYIWHNGKPTLFKEDKYHTMDELYDHRSMLFALICSDNPSVAWKSNVHSDGTPVEDGWFIAGLETPYGQITYHQKMEFYKYFKCPRLDRAPKYDGHTPNDVLDRLKKILVYE